MFMNGCALHFGLVNIYKIIIFPLCRKYNYMLFPLLTAQNPAAHLSRELQMLSQSEICSEPQEAAEDHPETSTQIM